MFDASLFAAMKRDAYFINTSRGEIVVEEDLAYALKTGQIAGAAIDVTREEPLPANSPLIGIPNLILTPHLGGSSDDVRMQGSEMVVKILVSWRDGRRLVNCVQERIEA
jgi:glyoxylate reductase